jgi:glycosyltransferase involved in cell wall biosynthesis
MKVLHVITGLGNGGAEAVLYNLCKFDRANTHVVISLMSKGKYGPLLEEVGATVISLNAKPGRVPFAAVFWLVRFMRSARPDVVQTWMLHADCIGGIAARIAGIRRVYWGVHHTTFDTSTPIQTKCVFVLNGMLSHVIPRKIICCSAASLKHLARSWYNSKKLLCVQNGYDVERFKPDPGRNRQYLQSTTLEQLPVLCVIGRFHPQKDHATLFHALATVKNMGYRFLCRCVGQGVDNHNRELTTLLANLKLDTDVVLEGPSSNVPDVLLSSDILVFSSSFGEAFPNVLNEAMACAVPCVTTDVGDAALIVGETGWVAPPRNPDLLATQIINALIEFKRSDEFQQRRERARDRIVRNFTIDRMIRNYNYVWKTSALEPH